MPPSAFDGIFTDTTMTRGTRVLRDPPEFDAAGDPIVDTIEQSIRVIADSLDRNTLRERYGANAGEVVLILTLLDPMIVPDNVQPGTEFVLAYSGRPGIVRIVARPAETLPPVRDVLGDVLHGVWRPT